MADLSKQPLFLQSIFLIIISCTFILQFSASNDVGFAFGEVLQKAIAACHIPTSAGQSVIHGSFGGL